MIKTNLKLYILFLLIFFIISITIASGEEVPTFQWKIPSDFNTGLHPNDLAVDDNGNLYVADVYTDSIWKFTSSGTYIDHWGSHGKENGQFYQPYAIAIDKTGKIYIADTYNNRIQEFTSSGLYVDQWGSFGSGNGQFYQPFGVTVDMDGNVYVADTNNHRIQKFTSSGTYVTQWGSLGSANGQFKNPSGIAVDINGNVYVADTNNHRIQKFTSSGTYVTQWGSLGIANGQFKFPYSIEVDNSGNVYITDSSGKRQYSKDEPEIERIQKFTSSGVYLTQWGSPGNGNGQFHAIGGISIDKSGNIFIADRGNVRIQQFTLSGEYVTQWGSYGDGNGRFYQPYAVAIDKTGNIYLADTGNNRIQKFTPSGLYVDQWGSFGSGNGEFDSPQGIAVDIDDNVYVADTFNNRIQKFTSSGTYVTQWGDYGYIDKGDFDDPSCIAVDMNGYVYIGDTHRIQKFTSSGTYVTQWGDLMAGIGDGEIAKPKGIAVDTDGNVYVADTGNNRIQKFTSSGTYVTQWGSYGNNTGQFNSPEGIAVDTNGNVYVVDSRNYRIKEFTSSGTYLTQWGGAGNIDGHFMSPRGIAVDASGNIYITDIYIPVIQKFTFLDTVPTTIPTTIPTIEPIQNPTIISLNPSSISRGSEGFTLEVTGNNFVDGAKVLWDGQERATEFISETKLTATILKEDVASEGTFTIKVRNPDGKESNEKEFKITTPESSSLKIGDIIITTLTVNVRSDAGLDSSIIDIAGTGTTGHVIDGPESKDGYVWWKVDFTKYNYCNNHYTGWSIENNLDRDLYFATAYNCVIGTELDGTQTVTRTISDKNYELKGSFLYGGYGVCMQGTGRISPTGEYIRVQNPQDINFVKSPFSDAVKNRYASLGISDFTGFGNMAIEYPENARFEVTNKGVIGASNRILVPWHSIATDRTLLPDGTTGTILFMDEGIAPDGSGQIIFSADDTGGGICGKHIDIYVGEGEAALNQWTQTGGNRFIRITSSPQSNPNPFISKNYFDAPWEGTAMVTQGNNNEIGSHYTADTWDNTYALDITQKDKYGNKLSKFPVLAPADGKVEGIFTYPNSGGTTLVIKHIMSNTVYYSVYCHLSEVKVKKTDSVSRGQIVAMSGWTGHVIPQGESGAHLHFHIFDSSKVGLHWDSHTQPITNLYMKDLDAVGSANSIFRFFDSTEGELDDKLINHHRFESDNAVISSYQFQSNIGLGETIKNTVSIDESTDYAQFTLSYPGSKLSLYLLYPNGSRVIINESSPTGTMDSNINYSSTYMLEKYIIKSPQSGIWTTEIYGENISNNLEPYTFLISQKSNVSLSLIIDRYEFKVNSSIPLNAFFGNNSLGIAGANANVIVTGPDNLSQTYNMTDNGDGWYEGITSPFNIKGEYQLKSHALKGSIYREDSVYIEIIEEYNLNSPISNFKIENTTGRVPLSLQFLDNSTGNITTRHWSFGDGTFTENVTEVTHTYTAPGDYTVTLTVSGPDGEDSSSQVITVFPLPIPPEGIINLHNSTYLKDSITWVWTDPQSSDFDHVMVYLNGAFQSNVTKGTQVYTATGLSPSTPYTIGTRTVGTTGLVNSTWVNQTAITAPDSDPGILPPEAQFTSNITSGTAPLMVQFNDSSSGTVTSYAWDFGDGANSTEQNPVHTYTNYGIYNVSLTVTNAAGEEDTITKNDFIQVIPMVGGDTGYYLIHCNVEGAEVYFDQDSKGVITDGTLLVKIYLTATPYHRYSVSKAGYVTVNEALPSYPAKDQTKDIFVTLVKVTDDSWTRPPYPDVTKIQPGYPDTNWTRPPYPDVTKIQPGYPDTNWTRPPYPDVTKIQPGHPDTNWTRPPYPDVTKIQPGYPDTNWTRPLYLDWLWNRPSMKNFLKDIFG